MVTEAEKYQQQYDSLEKQQEIERAKLPEVIPEDKQLQQKITEAYYARNRAPSPSAVEEVTKYISAIEEQRVARKKYYEIEAQQEALKLKEDQRLAGIEAEKQALKDQLDKTLASNPYTKADVTVSNRARTRTDPQQEYIDKATKQYQQKIAEINIRESGITLEPITVKRSASKILSRGGWTTTYGSFGGIHVSYEVAIASANKFVREGSISPKEYVTTVAQIKSDYNKALQAQSMRFAQQAQTSLKSLTVQQDTARALAGGTIGTIQSDGSYSASVNSALVSGSDYKNPVEIKQESIKQQNQAYFESKGLGDYYNQMVGISGTVFNADPERNWVGSLDYSFRPPKQQSVNWEVRLQEGDVPKQPEFQGAPDLREYIRYQVTDPSKTETVQIPLLGGKTYTAQAPITYEFKDKETAEKVSQYLYEKELAKQKYTNAKVLPLEGLYQFVAEKQESAIRQTEKDPTDILAGARVQAGNLVTSTLNLITEGGQALDTYVLNNKVEPVKPLPIAKTYYDVGFEKTFQPLSEGKLAVDVGGGFEASYAQMQKQTWQQNLGQSLVVAPLTVLDALTARSVIKTGGKILATGVKPIYYPVSELGEKILAGKTVSILGKPVLTKTPTGFVKGLPQADLAKVGTDFAFEVGQGGKLQGRFNLDLAKQLQAEGKLSAQQVELIEVATEVAQRGYTAPTKIRNTEIEIENLTKAENKALNEALYKLQNPSKKEMKQVLEPMGQIGGSRAEITQLLKEYKVKAGDIDVAVSLQKKSPFTITQKAQAEAKFVAKELSKAEGKNLEVRYFGATVQEAKYILQKGFSELPSTLKKTPAKVKGEAVLKIVIDKERNVIGIKQVGKADKEFKKIIKYREQQSRGLLIKEAIKEQKRLFKQSPEAKVGATFKPKPTRIKKEDIIIEPLYAGGKQTFGTVPKKLSKAYTFIPTGERLTKVSKVIGDLEEKYFPMKGKNVYYQGTTDASARSILDKGFNFKKAGLSTKAYLKRVGRSEEYATKRSAEISPPDTAFFTPDFKRALKFAQEASKSRGGKPVVLRIELADDFKLKRVKALDPKKETFLKDIEQAKKEGYQGFIHQMGGKGSAKELIIFKKGKGKIEEVGVVQKAKAPTKSTFAKKVAEFLDNKDVPLGSNPSVEVEKLFGKTLKGKGIVEPTTGLRLERLPEQFLKRMTSSTTMQSAKNVARQIKKFTGDEIFIDTKSEIIIAPPIKRVKDIIKGYQAGMSLAKNLQTVRTFNPYRAITNPRSGRIMESKMQRFKQLQEEINPLLDIDKAIADQQNIMKSKTLGLGTTPSKTKSDKVSEAFESFINKVSTPTSTPLITVGGSKIAQGQQSATVNNITTKIVQPQKSATVKSATVSKSSSSIIKSSASKSLRSVSSPSSFSSPTKSISASTSISSPSSFSSRSVGSISSSIGSRTSFSKNITSASPTSPTSPTSVGSPTKIQITKSPSTKSPTSVTKPSAPVFYSYKRVGAVPFIDIRNRSSIGKKKTRKDKDFIGNVRLDSVLNVYNRKDLIYGDTKIAKLEKQDIRVSKRVPNRLTSATPEMKKKSGKKKKKSETLLGFEFTKTKDEFNSFGSSLTGSKKGKKGKKGKKTKIRLI